MTVAICRAPTEATRRPARPRATTDDRDLALVELLEFGGIAH
ncbi:hypothetical protein [Nocardioides bizhenqiangii]|uniref:Uncharacterized protein n=1 Tax=Nocardioides bizhenqiangii TaxID=3095076 RepID=A0ABZ0ZPB9_9ACTN|nr:hypothetical protein [Nocardioides sp. HM61]WQQ26155.1 hypothetical protein SHK19_19605 [Nocardioides sp. HM61]